MKRINRKKQTITNSHPFIPFIDNMASQTLSEEFGVDLNGLAIASQDPDFDPEEDNYESAQTSETIRDEEDELTLNLKLDDFVNNYVDKIDAWASSTCQVLASAGKLEDFRMICTKLDPKEFPNLVGCSATLTAFHVYLVKMNSNMPKYSLFS